MAKDLSVWRPHFYSVTFGAGGSTQQGSLRTVEWLLQSGFDAAPHLSCIGATSEGLREQIRHYQRLGVKRIVALRGDLPSGYGGMGEFRYASDLVSFIRAETGDAFHIEVACYPETHPQAASPKAWNRVSSGLPLGCIWSGIPSSRDRNPNSCPSNSPSWRKPLASPGCMSL